VWVVNGTYSCACVGVPRLGWSLRWHSYARCSSDGASLAFPCQAALPGKTAAPKAIEVVLLIRLFLHRKHGYCRGDWEVRDLKRVE